MPRRARVFGRRKGKVDRAELVKSSFFSLLIIITTTVRSTTTTIIFFFSLFLCLFLSFHRAIMRQHDVRLVLGKTRAPG